MKKVFVYGTVMIALAATPSWAQQPNRGSQGTIAPAAPAAGARAQQNPDHNFILDAAMGSMAEVELGQLAATKAQSDQVKQFAQRMVTDHGKANDELKSLVQSKNITLPTDSGAHHKAIKDRLEKMSGAAFDRAYMQEMVTEHRKDVNAFRKESQSGKDAEVKAWAAKTLPTLEEHLQMAQSASRAAVGTSGTAGSTKSGSDTERGTGGTGTTGGTRGGTTGGDTARPGTGSGAGGSGTGTGTSSGPARPGSGGPGATGSGGSGTTGAGGSGTTGSGAPR